MRLAVGAERGGPPTISPRRSAQQAVRSGSVVQEQITQPRKPAEIVDAAANQVRRMHVPEEPLPPDEQGSDRSVGTDSIERVQQLTDAWESTPLTDPIAGEDPDAQPIGDHGDTAIEDERIAQRPDF